MKKLDFIIVGCGLAGSLLSRELLGSGYSVHVIDSAKQNSASRVAIGLVNPITGKRLVKSWLIDELIPKARAVYTAMESQFEQQLMHDCRIARVIPNQDIFEQWQPNFQQAVDEGYISESIHELQFGEKNHQYFLIEQAFWVNVKKLVDKQRETLQVNHQLTTETFDYSQLSIENHHVTYRELQADKIVFCEGSQGSKNPYFKHLPFNLNKGEVVRAELSNYQFKDVLKKNVFILEDGDSHRIGATYNREQIDEELSQKALDYFQAKLSEIGLSGSFVEHKAAIRPATVDRRPFIGSHKDYKNVMIFNGFGAKGVSLIPYFAEKFIIELQGGAPVMKEASTRRFLSS